jgi:hypothetical protein
MSPSSVLLLLARSFVASKELASASENSHLKVFTFYGMDPAMQCVRNCK